MTGSLANPRPGGRPGSVFLPVAAVIAFWAAVHVALLLVHAKPVLGGALIDTDSYMKLLRIEQLLTTGAWFDGAIARSNAPFGETLHWTRLFDIVVVALAAPLLPLVELKRALYLVGVAVSPLLHLGLGIAMLWAFRPVWQRCDRPAILLALIVTLLQTGIAGYALAGRADHHVMLMVLFTLAFGCFLRMMVPAPGGAAAGSRGLAPASLAGLACALGLWSSVELLPVAAVGAVAGGIAWIIRGHDFEPSNRRFAFSFVAFSAAALIVERPPSQYFAAEYDRISIAQIAAAGAVALTWLLIGASRRWLSRGETRGERMIVAACAAAAAGLALYFLFPPLFAGPSASFDPALRSIWLERVTEMRPLWPGTAADAAKLFAYCGTAMFALPVVVHRLWRRERGPEWAQWLVLGVGLAAAAPIALAHLRYSAYCEILAAPALAVIVHGFFAWSRRLRAMASRVVIRVVALAAFFLAPFGAAAAVQPARPSGAPKSEAEVQESCGVRHVLSALVGPESPWRGRSIVILTHIDLGPEMLYRTPHRVIGTPYHRNRAGLADNVAAMGGKPEAARAIVGARKVEAVLICRAAEDAVYFAKPGSGSLQERLAADDVPSWLAPVSLPASAAAAFRLYMVKPR